MRAAAPVTATLARLVGATTEEDRFKILVDLYDRGFEDGADFEETRPLTRWMCTWEMPCEDCEQGDHEHCFEPEVVRETETEIFKYCGCDEQRFFTRTVGHG
jgi:hypothetical protein